MGDSKKITPVFKISTKIIEQDINIYKCTLCSFTSRQNFDLSRHMVNHGRQGSTRQDSIHTNPHRISCENCPYTCVNVDELKFHRATHTLNKNPICSKLRTQDVKIFDFSQKRRLNHSIHNQTNLFSAKFHNMKNKPTCSTGDEKIPSSGREDPGETAINESNPLDPCEIGIETSNKEISRKLKNVTRIEGQGCKFEYKIQDRFSVSSESFPKVRIKQEVVKPSPGDGENDSTASQSKGEANRQEVYIKQELIGKSKENSQTNEENDDAVNSQDEFDKAYDGVEMRQIKDEFEIPIEEKPIIVKMEAMDEEEKIYNKLNLTCNQKLTNLEYNVKPKNIKHCKFNDDSNYSQEIDETRTTKAIEELPIEVENPSKVEYVNDGSLIEEPNTHDLLMLRQEAPVPEEGPFEGVSRLSRKPIKSKMSRKRRGKKKIKKKHRAKDATELISKGTALNEALNVKLKFKICSKDKGMFTCKQCNYTTPWGGEMNWHHRLHCQMRCCDRCDFICHSTLELNKHTQLMHKENARVSVEGKLESTSCEYKFDETEGNFKNSPLESNNREKKHFKANIAVSFVEKITEFKSSLEINVPNATKEDFKDASIASINHTQLQCKIETDDRTDSKFNNNNAICEAFGKNTLNVFPSRFICDQCQLVCNTLSHLEIHKVTHDNKPFTCDLCSHTAKSLWLLKKHKFEHIKDKFRKKIY